MKYVNYLLVAMLCIFSLTLTACTGGADEKKRKEHADKSDGSYTVTDITGREIKLLKRPERVAVLGHGGLKFYVYVSGDEHLIGVEEIEKKGHTVEGQSFHYAYPKLRELPIIGKGGPKFSPDFEQLAYHKPDLVFAAHLEKDALNQLQEKLQVPVIGIAGGMKGDIFSDSSYRSLAIVGEVMQKTERAETLISYLKKSEADLKKRVAGKTAGIRTYLGGCSYRGEQGILSTKAHIDLLDVPGVNNVMTDQTKEISIILDREKVLELNPNRILVDLSGHNRVQEEIKAYPDFFASLQAVKDNEVYAIMPYFTYGMNYDTAVLDLYYIGKLNHPESFEDVVIEAKAKEIYQLFVGKDVYPDLKSFYPMAFENYSLKTQ